ncbi:MAG: hypothetical protein IIA49_12550 [Bacteroidetes bacterium]|nr:hypothetical protein [Bacteroidota bacterium]
MVTTSAGAFALSIFSWIFPLPFGEEMGLSLSSLEHPQRINIPKLSVKIKYFVTAPFCFF